MSLADDVQAHTQQQSKPKPCTTGVWLSGIPERDRGAFQAFLSGGGAASQLHQIAVRNGCPTAETQFRAHCKQRCTCYVGAEIAA